MTQPTGEHASGVKLASAYVEVTARDKDGHAQVKQSLDTIADHGTVVGQKTGQNIVEGLKSAGPQAATAFGTGMESETRAVEQAGATHASKYLGKFKDSVRNSRMGEDFEYLLGRNDDLAAKYGGVHGETYATRFVQVLAGHAIDMRDAGQKAGEAVGAGAIAGLDRGGLQDYISRMQTWKIEAQRSVMEIGNTYAQMQTAGVYSLDQLKQKHEELASAQEKVKEGSLNIADAQNRLRSMGRDIENVGFGAAMGENFKRASEGVSGLSSHLGEAGEKAGGLGEKLGALAAPLAMFADPAVIGVGAVLGVVGALGEVINKVNELGESWEEVDHKLEITTGATGERLEVMKEQVKDVYGQVTNSKDQVTGLVSAVNTAFKDTGQGANDVTVQLAHLQSMVGNVDVTSLGTAFKGFNLGGNAQAQESVIDQLLKTSQQTQQPVQSYIETLQRLAPVSDQLHLSMRDTLAVLDEFGQAGVKPEQTFIIMNKAAQDATKHHKDFRTALQQDIDLIKNAPNEQAAEAAAKNIFGQSAGRGGAAQAIQAIRSGNLSLDPAMLAQLENADGLVNKTWKDTLTWKDTWKLFGHDVSDALQPVSQELHEKVQAGLERFIDYLQAHQGQIVGFATNVTHAFENIVTGIGKVINYLRPAFQQIQPQIHDVTQAFGGMEQSVGKDLLPVVEALGGAALVALKDIIENSGPVLEFFADLFNDVKKVSDWMHEHFGPDAKTALTEFQQDWQGAKHDVETIVDAIKDVVRWIDEADKKVEHWKDQLNRIHIPGFGGGHPSETGGLPGGPGTVPAPGSVAGPGDTDYPPGWQRPDAVPGAQTGMALPGYGGGDIVPAMLEPGEHVTTKEEVEGVGGHDAMFVVRAMMRSGMLREILGFQTGGGVPEFGPGWNPNDQINYDGHVVSKPRSPLDWLYLQRYMDMVRDNPLYADDLNDSNTPVDQSMSSWVGLGDDPSIPGLRPALQGVGKYPWWGMGLPGFDTGGPVDIAPMDQPDHPIADYRSWYPGAFAQRGVLTGEVEQEKKSKIEASKRAGEYAGKGEKGAHFGGMGLRALGGVEALGQWGSYLGTAGEALEPLSKTLGLLALPWDAVGAVNWGLNMAQGTQYGPVERVDQWWHHFATAPGEYAKHGNQKGPWTEWRPGYKGSTSQKLHIPGTNTSLGDIGRSVWGLMTGHDFSDNYGRRFGGPIQRFASGGEVKPAGMGGDSEHGWVIDRFKMAKPKPLHFQLGGAVAGGATSWGGLNDVKALLAAESGRTPYSSGGYSPRGLDCSGLVAEAVEIYLGLPMSGSHPMSTGNEANWLAGHGFQQGYGPEGSFRVGFYNGGPGGGHTALTLPDGTNAESGGSGGGVRLGGGAAGANNSEFTDHWFLPPREVVSPGGWSTRGGGSSGGGGASGASYGMPSAGGGYGGGGGPSGGGGGGGGLWDRVAQAESSGNWANQDTGHSGHYGGLQFSPETWRAYGGQGNPADASREEQIEIANRAAFTGWNGTPPQGLKAWETITKGMVPGVTTSTPASAFGGDGFGGTGLGGTGGGATPEQLVAGQDRVTAATNRLHEAEAKLKADRESGDKTPEQLAKDEDHVTEARNKLSEATMKLQELQDKPGKAPKGERGGRGGGKGDDSLADLFGIGYKGIQEQLPEGFSNPLEWGATKSASALLKFFGAMLGGDGKGAAESLIGGGEGGGYGGGTGGPVSPYVQSLIAQVPGYTPQGGGSQTTINRNVTYTGPIQQGTHQSDEAIGARQILNGLRIVTA